MLKGHDKKNSKALSKLKINYSQESQEQLRSDIYKKKPGFFDKGQEYRSKSTHDKLLFDDAVKDNNTQRVKSLLKKHSFNIQKDHVNEYLQIAVDNDNIEIVQEILEKIPDNYKIGGRYWYSDWHDNKFGLRKAVNGNKVKIVELLLNKGVVSDTDGRLHQKVCEFITKLRKIEMLKIFFPEEPELQCDLLKKLSYLFDRAVKVYGNLELINNLFPNWNDKILFFDAVQDNNLELVRDLLKKGCDPNIQDNKGNIPLCYASTKKMFELLIEYHTDIHIKNNNQISIFDIVSDDFQSNLKTWYNEFQEEFLGDTKNNAELSGQD